MDYRSVQEKIDIYQNIPKNSTTLPATGKDENGRFVEMRYYTMTYTKQAWRDRIQGTQDLYYCNDWEWVLVEEGFDRPVRFPTLRDFTKALTDKFMQDPPEALLLPYHDDDYDLVIGKKKYIDELKSSPHEKRVRRQCIEDMFYFGEAYRAAEFYNYTREKKGKKESLFRDVATRRIDPRDVFVDENASVLHDKTRMAGARDIIIRTLLPYSTFLKNFRGRPGYYNIENVQPEMYTESQGLDYRAMNNREYWEKSPVMVVKLYEYENVEDDSYYCVANGFTIFEGKLSEVKGTDMFNMVNYKFEPRNDSYWGDNLASLLAPHIYAKDTIFNLELMNLKLTLQPVLAVSGDFGYNPRVHVLQPGGVWTAGGNFNGKVADSITPVISGNPNTRSYEMLQNINSELSITSRADLRTLEFYKDKTATETMSQKESMNAHNEYIEEINEVEAECILTEIIDQVMIAFMDEKDAETGNKRRVQAVDYVINQNESGEVKFTEKKGYEDFYMLTDEMINVKCRVKVVDKRGETRMKAEKLGRYMQFLPIVGNLMQLDPELRSVLAPVGMIEEGADLIGLDREKMFKKDAMYQDEYEMVKEEILLGNNVDVPPDETRRQNLNRLRYLSGIYNKYGKEFTFNQTQAFNYHLNQTIEAIQENKIEKLQQQVSGASQPVPPTVEQQLQQTGPQQGGPMPTPQDVTNVTPGGMTKMSQPLPGLMSATGTAPGIQGAGI